MALDKFQPYLFVSAGEQSNKFLTPAYADGIAQFQAQRAQSLTGLTVRIDLIQEGAGDPSPENIRSISGRTGMTVTRAGKNLLAQTDVARTIYGVTFTPLADGGYHISGTPTANTYYIIYGGFESSAVPAPSYLVNGVQYVGSIDSNKCNLQIYLYGQGRYWQNDPFTVNRDVITACGIFLYVAAGTTIDEDVHPQIEVGRTATAYEPPTNTTYPITWESIAGTVYGGTLDVVSGVLTVDKIIRQCDENSNFAKGGPTSIHEYYLRNGASEDETGISGTWYDAEHIICSHAANYSELSTTGIGTRLSGGQARIYFPLSSDLNTLALFKTWLGEQATAGTPLQFCYKLATPQTYQLTPTEVRTLTGFNQIYSDAGPVIDIKF